MIPDIEYAIFYVCEFFTIFYLLNLLFVNFFNNLHLISLTWALKIISLILLLHDIQENENIYHFTSFLLFLNFIKNLTIPLSKIIYVKRNKVKCVIKSYFQQTYHSIQKIKFYFQRKFKKLNRIFFCLFSICCFSFFARKNISFCRSKRTYEEYFHHIKFFFILASTLTFLSKAFCSDAGSIPVKRTFILTMEEKEISNDINFKEIKLNNHTIQLKFCRTCMVWRPPRTSHCSFCGGCKLKFDHHCPWIGKCVALKNYRYFLFFILYLFWFLISNLDFFLKDQYTETKEWLNLLKIFLKLAGFFASIFTCALIVFHIYLGYTGKTTSEFLKFPDKSIRSWNFRKEVLNKFYKKNISTIIKIRFSEKKKFFLIGFGFKTDLEKKNIVRLIKKTTLNLHTKLLKNFFSFFILFFSYCYFKDFLYRGIKII